VRSNIEWMLRSPISATVTAVSAIRRKKKSIEQFYFVGITEPI
jgi:hypothetical protein